MAWSFTKNDKKCGSCEFWTGPRTLDKATKTRMRADTSAKGECMAEGGHRIHPVTGTCSKWKAWGVFK